MHEPIVIDPRFNGPPASGNGGYACGLVAAAIDGPAEVTLRLPPPLGRPLALTGDGEVVRLLDGDAVVAEARPVEVNIDPRGPVSFAEAERAARTDDAYAREHVFPTCFVCGPARAEGDGLRIFPGALNGDDELFAAPWVPDASLGGSDGRVRTEFVWASLDCPGAWPALTFGPEMMVLGRLAVRVDSAPRVGERCVLTGWSLGADGRKRFAGTALWGEDGALLGLGSSTWIVVQPRA